MANWMIYGAYGYTGILVIEEAIKRGHRPMLAGRSEAKLQPLATRYDLPYRAFALNDSDAIAAELHDIDILYHAAGPFIYTSDPMIRACLQSKTHYVDITGEIPVFENTFSYDQQAHEAGIALISGVGFDVIPTDCMARYIADKTPNATHLDIAIAAISKTSAGTAKSGIELADGGGQVRRDGELQPFPFGQGARKIRFNDRERRVMPIPWGDLATAYRTTGIPNITTYMAFPAALIALSRLTGGMIPYVMSSRTVKNGLLWMVDKVVKGPDENARKSAKSFVWVRATDDAGNINEAWLETLEGYDFTAVAGVRVIEAMLQGIESQTPIIGATTPALAFGADFVLDLPKTQRFDHLP
ncbi:MAG: saccharopine dehydrogenase NADP-binding domain-containing protein [Aggregatilineales bacterium]